MAKRLVRYLAIEYSLQMEIKATLEHINQSYNQCCAISEKERNKNKVELTITYGMGWQKILYGKIYDFSSGYAFIIGGISKGIIGMVVYSKACCNCDYPYNIVEDAE